MYGLVGALIRVAFCTYGFMKITFGFEVFRLNVLACENIRSYIGEGESLLI